jgi:hypothetical protein
MNKTYPILCALAIVELTAQAQDAQTFRRAFKIKPTVLRMQGSEHGEVVEPSKIVPRTNSTTRRADNIDTNGKGTYYISDNESIEISDVANKIRIGDVIIASGNITLKKGVKYTTHYSVVAQRDVTVAGVTTTSPVESVDATEGYIKFEENKVWVNPNLGADYTDEGIYYYKLSNRQTLKFSFDEWTVSALTLPLKYRFKGSRDGNPFSEDFTTAINLNAFIGRTLFGQASYHYRDKVGSITTTKKIMYGVILGASTVTLDKNNTSASSSPSTGDTKITKGLATAGFGLTGSINKINIGLFGGVDFSIGDDASRWNYNRRPWIGLAIGYSLFPFAQL